MKKIILIILISIGFSQSSWSFVGFGETSFTTDPASISLGNSHYFSGSSDNVSLSSPSSYWQSSLTKLSMVTSFNWTSFSDNPEQFNQNIQLISFIFPAWENTAFSFGLTPQTRVKFSISEELDLHNSTYLDGITYVNTSSYQTNGGISDFFISYSAKMTEQFSFGLRWDTQFGLISQKDSVDIYQLVIDNDNEEEVVQAEYDHTNRILTNKHFSGNSFDFEGRFNINKNDFVFSAKIKMPLKVRLNQNINGIDQDEQTHLSESVISDYGFGYSFENKKQSGIVFELHRYKQQTGLSDLNLFKTSIDNCSAMNLGLYRRYNNLITDRWDSFIPRFGIFASVSEKDGIQYWDKGLTFGFGLEYFKHKNTINLSVEVGTRENWYDELSEEKYINLTLGLTTGDKWFKMRKRK
jgi:hypothetical protein